MPRDLPASFSGAHLPPSLQGTSLFAAPEVVKAIDLMKPPTARSQRGVKSDASDPDEADDE